MSIREEIRAGFVKLGFATAEQLLEHVPGVEGDLKKLRDNLQQLKVDGKARRTGLDEEKRVLWAIDQWPVNEDGTSVRKPRTPPPESAAPEATAAPEKKRAAKKVKRAPTKTARPEKAPRKAAPTKAPAPKRTKPAKAAKKSSTAKRTPDIVRAARALTGPSSKALRLAKSILTERGLSIEDAVAAVNGDRTPRTESHDVTRIHNGTTRVSLEAQSGANATQIGGDHYKRHTLETWDVITDWQLGFLDGNAVKYLSRWRIKGGVEDLKKARHYIDKLIETTTAEAA